MKKNIVTVSVLLLTFVGGFVSSSYLNSSRQENLNETYPLLAKRLFIDNPNDIQFDFRELKNTLEADLVAGLGSNEKKVSVYFEYLPSNITMSINPELEAVAASLMKTALAMEVYKGIEEGSISRTDSVTLDESMVDTSRNSFGDLYKSGVGATYTVDELIDIMLKKSDNTASNALTSLLDSPFEMITILDVLDIKTVANEDSRLIINTKDYSKIFKCLYFSCYNSKYYSQEILNKLTQTEFKNRITKLLPNEVTVAHKIGTFNNEYQSDCGIVYANNGSSNYLICIMVNADDPEASEEIARISYKVYSYVNSLNDN